MTAGASFVILLSLVAGGNSVLSQNQGLDEKMLQGEGLIVTLRDLGPVARTRFSILIQQAGLPEDLKQVKLDLETAHVSHVRIHRGALVAIVSERRDGNASVTIVDGRTGAPLFERTCTSVRLTDDRNNYMCPGVDGIDRAYNLTRRQAHRTTGVVEGALKALSSGSLRSRLEAVRAYRRSIQMQASPEVRDALIAQLRMQAQADHSAASRTTNVAGPREYTMERQYLGELIRTTGQFAASAIVDIVASVDHDAVHSILMAEGSPAVPAILAALAEPTPPGYSHHYRASRLLTLLLIAQDFAVDSVDVRRNLAPILTAAFERPRTWAELLHAMRLAAEFGLDAFDAQIELFTRDTGALRALGIVDETAIGTIQNAARELMLRRSARLP